MTRISGWLILAAVLAMPLLAAPSHGGDDTREEAKKLQAGDVELMTEAFNLAEAAQKHKIPEAYVGAGRLMLRLQHQTKGKLAEIDAEVKVEDENGTPIKGAKAEPAKESTEFARLAEHFFADALALAVEQKNIEPVKALIKAVKDDPGGQSERGALGGPKAIARIIGPGQQHTWTFAFDTNFVAAVGFQANAACNCRMVNDAGHKYFDQRVAVGRYVWQPRMSVSYRAVIVTIRNPHRVPVTYRLFTN